MIKDTPFDISSLKAKRRYEINKGRKNFEVKKISPVEYVDQLLKVTKEAYQSWPEKYRSHIDDADFRNTINSLESCDVFAAFYKEASTLSGYAQLYDRGSFVEFSVLRVNPECEHLGVNAAIVDGILDYYKDRFDGDFYINDGSRAIRHETSFQDYLEKYFEFRKAYCRLEIKYRLLVGAIIQILYPIRKHINAESGIGSQVSGILRMEEIRRFG